VCSSKPSEAIDRTAALVSFQRTKVRYCLPAGHSPAPWALRRRLDSYLIRLPAACLREMTEASGGFVAFSDGDTAYHPGPWQSPDCALQGVAVLNASSFLEDPRPGLYALARLLDHLLGSLCTLPARFITDGQAHSPHWADFYRRLVAAHQLGYADDPAAQGSLAVYFRWAFAGYLEDPGALQSTDPRAHRLLHSTLFSAAFWQGHPLRPRPDGLEILCPA
jgi:hypothetical protein